MRRMRLVTVGAVMVGALASISAAAPEQVTIDARPSISRWLQSVTVFGSVDSRRADEIVTIEAKDCGQPGFREVDSARTSEGGAWSTQFSTLINTTLRAVWNGRVSRQVPIRVRPGVALRRRSERQFNVRVQGSGGSGPFWRKKVIFQRLDRRLGTWVTVKRVVLTESTDDTRFRAAVPKSSVVRAVLPLSQARPCYLAGYSNQIQT